MWIRWLQNVMEIIGGLDSEMDTTPVMMIIFYLGAYELDRI